MVRSRLVCAACCLASAIFGGDAPVAAAGGRGEAFRADLPVAEAQALLEVDAACERVAYRVAVPAVTGAVSIAVHLGRGGPPVATLFGPQAPSEEPRTLLAAGTLRGDDLAGPSLAALVGALRGGQAWLEVHGADERVPPLRARFRADGRPGARCGGE